MKTTTGRQVRHAHWRRSRRDIAVQRQQARRAMRRTRRGGFAAKLAATSASQHRRTSADKRLDCEAEGGRRRTGAGGGYALQHACVWGGGRGAKPPP
jgi:hypothetical protein